MRTQFKKYRVRAAMTQEKVATALRVSQPTYQRWEAGTAPVPEDKLKKLAKVLKASPDELLGKHPPIQARLYDDSAGDEVNYYGEVAIHFRSGCPPLLLTISEAAFSRLHRSLQGDAAFITVDSLSNQTVALRADAIEDLYFSSEAYDGYGPEHDAYDLVHLQLPDTRDWEIVECLAFDRDTKKFDPSDVQRVCDAIMITDEQWGKLVSDGHVKQEDLERERAARQKDTELFFKLATDVVYQLSTGKQRSVFVADPRDLYNAFCWLTEFDGDDGNDMLRIEAEGRHRIIFINREALDYVSIPTHLYEQGQIDISADEMETEL